MAIATLAAVNQFVFAYLHIRLKLSRTSRLQQSSRKLFATTVVQLSLLQSANWMAPSLESVHPYWRAVCRVGLGLDRP